MRHLASIALIHLVAALGCDGGAIDPPRAAVFGPDGAAPEQGVPPDAGHDAASPDAAADAQPARDAEPVADAYLMDAAVDARPRDAGTPDAEPPPDALDVAAWQRGSIYLLMVDRFANGAPDPDDDFCVEPGGLERFHGGDLVGLRQRLDYLEELGVDTLWVTPLTAQIPRHRESCGYHGYWTNAVVPDDGALEPRLGTADDLHALLADLHGRGMRLILDMVVNHPGYNAPITRSHPGWFHPRAGCEALGDPEETCPLSGLPDYDHAVPEVIDYLVASSVGWATRFAIDGVRMDTVKHVPLAFFAQHWIPAMKAARPALYLVGELFDGAPYDTQRPYLDAGFDALFDFRLRFALVDGLAKRGDLDPAAQRVQEAWRSLGPERALLRSTFLENHDVPRFATEITADTAEEAGDRLHLALGVLLTTPGIPQLYAGTELGKLGAWPENRRMMPDWAWDAASRTPHAGYLGHPGETFELTRDLLRLRRQTPALHAGDYAELWRPGGSGVPLYAFARGAGESRVIVAIYAGAEALDEFRLPVVGNPGLSATDAAWYGMDPDLEEALDHARGARGRMADGALLLSLPPRSVTVWAAPR